MSEDIKATETEVPTEREDSVAPLESEEPVSNAEVENSAPQDTTVSASAEAESLDSEGQAIQQEIDPLERSTEAEAVATDAEVIARLATEVESLRLQVEERTSQCVRMAADFDNFRKRTEREKSELELRVKRDAISDLLPVIDSFERAKTQIKPQTDQEVNIHMSYQGVYKQLVDGLKRLGVSPMRAEGQPFDPNLHDAIMREPTAEYPEGTVMEELRRGYLLGDLVLRHAMVKVAAPLETADPTTEAEEVEASSEAV